MNKLITLQKEAIYLKGTVNYELEQQIFEERLPKICAPDIIEILSINSKLFVV